MPVLLAASMHWLPCICVIQCARLVFYADGNVCLALLAPQGRLLSSSHACLFSVVHWLPDPVSCSVRHLPSYFKLRLVCMHGCRLVNSAVHVWGSKAYDTDDE
jgi:hypothetical protein